MMKQINSLLTGAYLNAVGFFRGLRDDERGLSGVVVAVLLILVAVLAVVLLWGFLSGWISDMWTNITGKANQIQ